MADIGASVATGTIGPSGAGSIAYSNGFFVIASPWGPDGVTVRCDSFAAFVRAFGGLTKFTTIAGGTTNDTVGYETADAVLQGYYAIKGFFDNKLPGSPGIAYVCRVVKSSSGATAATKTFSDGGSNLTTVTAKDKGAGGNALRVTWTNPSPRKGSGYALGKFERRVGSQTVVIEYWDIGNANDAAAASRKSELVTITLPAGGQLPQTAAESKLNSGTPGTADAYDATASDYVGTVSAAGVRTGIQVFNDARLGSGYLGVPGKYSSTVRTGINTHCAAYDRMGYLGAPSGLTLSTVTSDLSTTSGNQLAYFWPQLRVADQTSDSDGSLLVDPIGHVMGLQSRMHRDYRGPHKSPAGITHPLIGVLDVECQSNGDELCSDEGSNTLGDYFINTIRRKGNPVSVIQWGNFTLATDQRYRQINASHTVNVVRQTLKLLIMEPVTHEPIDPQGRTFAKLELDARQFLDTLYEVGALYGNKPGKEPKDGDAYLAVCNRDNNTPTSLANNELRMDVSIVPTPNATAVKCNLMVAAPGYATGRAA